MRLKEFITESAKLWGAKVRISQANYVGYVDAQVWAANAQQARIMFKQQYNIQDHHVGSVKEIKMKAKEFVKEAITLPSGVADQAVQYISGPMLPKVNGNYRFQDVLKRVKEIKDSIAKAKQSGRLDVNSAEYKAAVAEIKKWADWLEASQAPARPGDPVINIGEANYNDPDFNPRIEVARLENLIKELPTATYERRKEIDKEIREIKNQLRLYQATLPPEPAKVPVEPDEGGPYMLYTDQVQAGQFGGRTLKGAKNSVQRAMMQQQAHVYAIATDNKNKIVAVWYPTDKENKYNVGDTYRPPNSTSYDQYNDQLRYPPGHPYAGAVMPPKIPVVTDWSQLPDGGLAAWMQGGQNPEAGATAPQQPPERYMGQAQRVDSQQGLPRTSKRRK
jgi:hypothetical protein